MAKGKTILLACAVLAGCASQREVSDQPAQVNLGPGGATITTIEPATVEVAPGEAAASSAEDASSAEHAKWQRIEDFLARQPEDAGKIEAKEMLGLWDELGRFRRDYWDSLTHARRTHCVAVLALCGNEGAIRAQGEGLSEESLRNHGPYIANGSFGKWAPDYPDGMGSAPFPKATIVSGDGLPDWKRPTQATIDFALANGLPLVICFLGGQEVNLDWVNPKLVRMSKGEAVFIRVRFIEEGQPSPEVAVVPTSKILSDNPAREYAVSPQIDTVIVADAHGNEFFRMLRCPQPETLKKLLDEVPAQAAKTNDKLQTNLDQAKLHLGKDERPDALKLMLKNFREGIVGMKAQVDTIEAYNKLIEEGRTELAKLVEAADKDGLRALAREFAGTDLEKEIDEAIKKLK